MTKDKELEALRERVKGLEQERNVQMLRALNATARAETAERELAALREALKPFSTLARWLPTKTPDDEVVYRVPGRTITAGDLRRAACAITGEKT